MYAQCGTESGIGYNTDNQPTLQTILDYNATASHDGESRSESGRETSTSSQPLPPPLMRICERRGGVSYVGRLAIGPGIVGYGSSGTLVFEGSLDGRPVAVKRVLRQVTSFETLLSQEL